MGLEPKQIISQTDKDPLREEFDRIISECEKRRGLLQVAAAKAKTPDELKFAVRLGAVEGKADNGQGEYITSAVDKHVVRVEQVFDAIDQYAREQRWVGFGGDVPPFIGDRLRQLYGGVDDKKAE